MRKKPDIFRRITVLTKELLDSITEKPKMVIVVRNDLKMRKGKSEAQAAHAASYFFQQDALWVLDDETKQLTGELRIQLSPVETKWLITGHAKISVGIDSEEELLSLLEQAE